MKIYISKFKIMILKEAANIRENLKKKQNYS